MGKHWKYKGRWICFSRLESDWHFEKFICFEVNLLVFLTVKKTVSAEHCELCHSWERQNDLDIAEVGGGFELFPFFLFFPFVSPQKRWRQSEVHIVVIIPNLKFPILFVINLLLEWIYYVLLIFEYLYSWLIVSYWLQLNTWRIALV